MIQRLDHLVLTVADIARTCDFYAKFLDFEARSFTSKGIERWALHAAGFKINLHPAGAEFEPKAAQPTPGSGDLCFTTTQDVEKVALQLAEGGVKIIDGPVSRTGARGELLSIYFRDPDGNLIEVSNQK